MSMVAFGIHGVSGAAPFAARAMIRSAAVLAGTVIALAGPARADPQVEVGMLRCSGAPSAGLIVISVQHLHCVFASRRGVGRRQIYLGTVRRLGLDIEVDLTPFSTLVWAVLGPTRSLRRGDLAGTYLGAARSNLVGVEVGGNSLVGGSGNAFALQPLSVEAQGGVKLSIGIEGLALRFLR